MPLRSLGFVLLICLCGSRMEAQSPAPDSARPVSVFAANGTVEVLEKIGAAFTRQTGTPVQVTGGGSPALAKKILAGEGADVFVAGSRGVLAELLRSGMVNEDSSFLWATNSLVVVARPGADPPSSPKEIAAERYRRIALPDPESTVQGPFMRQALIAADLWDAVRPRLVPTTDGEKALSLLGAGEADLAIVYATDARRLAGSRAVLSLPPKSHQPIPYPAVLVAHLGASPLARSFLDFLRSSQARAFLVEAGFTPAF